MTLGQLRRKTKTLPDSTNVIVRSNEAEHPTKGKLMTQFRIGVQGPTAEALVLVLTEKRSPNG